MNNANAPLPYADAGASLGFPRGFRLRRGRNWFFLGLLYAAYYLCRYNLSTVTPELAREFNLDNAQTGWLSTGRDFGYMIGTFINGLLADSLGGKQSMAIGALGTIVLNLIFGWFSRWDLAIADTSFLVAGFILIRTLDGYAQSFGSPGMVKINASWFKRHERGTFAGIFGGMIQLGQIGVNQLSGLLLNGFALTLFGVSIFVLARQNWRVMFVVPPIILAVVVVLMWLNVKNHPEQAGYKIEHDDDPIDADPIAKIPMSRVFLTIARNPIVWANAGAYMCTGFVRRGYDYWWAKYLDNVWHLGKDAAAFYWLGLLLPAVAVLGSFGAGFVSDKFFRARRSPVAATLYGLELLVLLAATFVLMTPSLASPLLACVFLTLISLTCNTSHSVIGTAAVMDIGGRRMSGFTLGVINSFQYLGAIMAGYPLGKLIDAYKWNALFASMIPFSLLGALLMALVWWKTRGRDVRGS